MSIPLSPQISLSPSSYSSSGTTITAAVSLMNRPTYHGKPAITGLTTITPKIVCSRTPSGVASFAVMVSACESSADAGNAWRDLHFEWNFGDTSGTLTSVDQWNGQTVNLNDRQTGPEAAYVYKTAGTYTITLTAKGKDENGTLITATTTSLLTVGMYFPFLGGATGGTYTLTFEGQTTAGIAYNASKATLESALTSLSNLDNTKVRVTYQGCVELFGDLTGASYSFTADFSGLTGTTGTPQLRVEQASSTTANVTVSDVSGLTAQYFDSEYDGSNGAGNGTESRPYTTVAALKTFVTGGSNRIAYLKAGSTFALTSIIKWEFGYSTIRMVSYGTGAKPIIAGSSNFNFTVEETYGTAGTPVRLGGDVVWEGLSFTHSGATQMFVAYASNNGTNTYIYSRYTDFAFIGCDYSSSVGLGSPSGLISAQGTTGRGRVLSNIYVFGGTLNMGQGNSQGIFTTADQWLSVVGTTFLGGDENTAQPYVFDHHIYPNVNGHQLYRYLLFGAGNKNLCINGNAHSTGGAVRYFVADGCDVTGTQNGFDFSNSDNNYNSGRTGHFDDVVVQFNKIHSGQLNSQRIGIIANNLFNVVIRDNRFYDNEQSNIVSSDTTKPTLFSIYRNVFFNGIIQIRANQVAYFHDNICHTDSENGGRNICISFQSGSTSVELWDCDGNIYYAPNGTAPFRNETTDQYVTFSTWQGYGNDASGSEEDPLWATPGDGVFINAPQAKIDWPAGFTSLGYSLDGGQNWNSYTDNQYVSVGASLAGHQSVHFRANAPGANGTYQVTAYSNASSLDTVEESASDTVVGSNLVAYFMLSAGGLIYTVQTGV